MIKVIEWVEEPSYSDIPSRMDYHPNFQGDINVIFATSGIKPKNDLFPKNTYMLYTGLKDSNGVEIYDQDIVEFEIPDYMGGKPRVERAVVQYSDKDAGFIVGGYVFWKLIENYNAKVVGNTFTKDKEVGYERD